jgi:hypothetical protein
MNPKIEHLKSDGVASHRWSMTVIYYLALLVVLVLGSKFRIEIDPSIVTLLVLAVLPFVLPHLQSIEAFGMKFAIRELKTEVIETRQVVRDELSNVRALSERFEMLLQKSEDFLQPKPLDDAFRDLSDIERSLREKELSEDEITSFLGSYTPNSRVPGYVELQLRPKRNRLRDLIDCLHLEHYLARKTKETRPLWQLLEALHKAAEQFTNLAQVEREQVRFAIRQTLEFLTNNPDLDTGGQCKISAQELLKRY